VAELMTSRDLAKLIYYYYEENCGSGNCHIVLEDNNIRDSDLEFCIKQCKESDDYNGLFIMEKMLSMKKTARAKSIKTAWELMRQEI
jgi:hypothetical protein